MAEQGVVCWWAEDIFPRRVAMHLALKAQINTTPFSGHLYYSPSDK
jgi:hypothetical protein